MVGLFVPLTAELCPLVGWPEKIYSEIVFDLRKPVGTIDGCDSGQAGLDEQGFEKSFLTAAGI